MWLRASLILLLTFSAPADVVVVRATTSAPNEAERKYAESMTRNMGRWLAEAGVVHRVLNDDQVSEATLTAARVVVLPYNPNPPPLELASLKQFIGRGGKLLVFYGGSSELAEAMGLRLGDYARASSEGQWAAIRMNSAIPIPCLPALIRQSSKNIRPALPQVKGSAVLGHWESAGGDKTSQPGLTLGPGGFWMSHVLLADADVEAKGRLLLAMIGYCDPAIWASVLAKLLKEETALGGSADFGATVALIRQRASAASDPLALTAALGRAQTLNERVRNMMREGRYREAVATLTPLRTELMTAYSLVQVARRGEFRGVWDHGGKGLYPGEWDRTAGILKRAGMTDVFANVLWPWMTHGKLKSVAPSPVLTQLGDQVAQGLTACHKQGLRYHAWKVCWKVEDAPEPFVAGLRRAGRLQVKSNGSTIPWLCPSDSVNRRMELNGIIELVQRYPVDGIHLDYIRYESPGSCYCPRCRQLFEKTSGRRVGGWPQEVTVGSRKAEYDTWRAGRITSFVQEVREGVQRARSNVVVSAAVYGHYPHCGRSIAQDWGVWLQKGHVDFVCPMDYFDDAATFEAYVKRQVALPGTKGRIYPGIGVTASESRLDAAQVMDQIGIVRHTGAAGFALFDLNPVLEKEVLPYLKLGITKP